MAVEAIMLDISVTVLTAIICHASHARPGQEMFAVIKLPGTTLHYVFSGFWMLLCEISLKVNKVKIKQ